MHSEDLLLVAILKWAANMLGKGVWSTITFTADGLGLMETNWDAADFRATLQRCMHTVPKSTDSLPTTKINSSPRQEALVNWLQICVKQCVTPRHNTVRATNRTLVLRLWVYQVLACM